MFYGKVKNSEHDYMENADACILSGFYHVADKASHTKPASTHARYACGLTAVTGDDRSRHGVARRDACAFGSQQAA
ncbi:MAG: hypothetical protein ABIN25_14125 [Ginsengibacter sp.]